jgi:hypothetical protein
MGLLSLSSCGDATHHASANAADAAAPLVAGALLGWLAASVRLATPDQAKDNQATSAELDRTVRQVFTLADQHMRWEFNVLARRFNY